MPQEKSALSSLSMLADGTADVAVSPPEILADEFRRYELYRVSLGTAGGARLEQNRSVLRVGRVVAVLALDPARGEVVLIRQFRLAAHLSNGKGALIEVVAGHVEAGEDIITAARRECQEEIGVAPEALYELFSFMPAPGLLEEYATLFLGIVDAARVPPLAGAADEAEHTEPLRIDIASAIAALEGGEVHNGYLLLALQWLARHWSRLDEFLSRNRPAGC
jgi:ADP-ribose pyrophosphatase